MFAAPVTLLAAVAALTTSSPLRVPPEFSHKPLGVNVFGTFVGTAILEGTVDTQAAVDGSTAVWSPIAGASWTAPGAVGVSAPFTHVRARVSAYTSGNVSVAVQ